MEGQSHIKILDRITDSKIFSIFFTKESFGQFCKYIIVGLLSFLLEYSMYFILVQKFLLWYILASAIVYFIIFWFNFILNRIWSFRSSFDIKKQLFRYVILFSFNLLATSALLLLLTEIIGLDPLVSKIIVMALIVPWNFTIYRKVIYK